MSLIKISQLSKENILLLFNYTKKYIKSPKPNVFIKLMFKDLQLENKILVTAFFEPSTRTQLSFESAMLRLGGKVLRFNKENSSIKKGETFTDTIKTLENYGDILVIRHSENGILDTISNITHKPVINGGDGSGEHPTQALLDLFCIWLKFGNDFVNKTIVLYGDCSNSRTIASLSKLLDLFNINYYYLAYPGRYKINNYSNIALEYLKDINPDVIYCTRMQNERTEGCNIPRDMIINQEFIEKHISNEKIKNNEFLLLHPLPRNEEIDSSIDKMLYSGYFKAMDYSVYLRSMIICFMLNNTFDL